MEKSFEEKYPLAAKISKVQDECTLLSSFLDYLQETYGSKVDLPNLDRVIAGFYNIDYEQWQKEKEAAYKELLQQQRQINQTNT